MLSYYSYPLFYNYTKFQGKSNNFSFKISGLKVIYKQWSAEGSSVSEVLIRCTACDGVQFEALNVSATYTVLIPQYMYAGGDGYNMIKTQSIAHQLYGTILCILFDLTYRLY